MQEQPPSAVFLMGPTASGKTSLAVNLVQRSQSHPLEIISVDSALVYRGLDIGTAKPDQETLDLAPHRLIDVCEPTNIYSASQFREDALAEMAEISSRGRIPLLVGGTMLYFRALEYGLSSLPEADTEVRDRLEQEWKDAGLNSLHQRLSVVDPDAAARIHRNDSQRILRALEVWELTGKSLSELQSKAGDPIPYRLMKLILAPEPRQVLHKRIEQRFRQMLNNGFESEVKRLLESGLDPDLPAMRSVGYRQMAGYLRGEYDYQTMVEKALAATRQLAKRQLTWLRSEKDAIWLDESEDLLDRSLALISGLT